MIGLAGVFYAWGAGGVYGVWMYDGNKCVYIYMMDELVVLEVWLGWCELCMGCWMCLLICIYKWIMDWLIGDYICIVKKNWLTG